MIRSILVVLTVFLLCLSGLIVWPLMWILHFFNPKASDRLGFVCLKAASKTALFLCGARIKAEGLENLPKKGETVLFVMNHRSYFDVLTFYSLAREPAGFIAKKEVSRIPLFSWWLLMTHSLFLDRKDIRAGMKTILKGIDYLKAGHSMCIFPEGTRNRNPEDLTAILEFHGGSFKLAERSGVPVIPVAFYNTSSLLEDHFPFIRPAEIRVRFGAPVSLSSLEGENRKFVSRYFERIISQDLKELSL